MIPLEWIPSLIFGGLGHSVIIVGFILGAITGTVAATNLQRSIFLLAVFWLRSLRACSWSS